MDAPRPAGWSQPGRAPSRNAVPAAARSPRCGAGAAARLRRHEPSTWSWQQTRAPRASHAPATGLFARPPGRVAAANRPFAAVASIQGMHCTRRHQEARVVPSGSDDASKGFQEAVSLLRRLWHAGCFAAQTSSVSWSVMGRGARGRGASGRGNSSASCPMPMPPRWLSRGLPGPAPGPVQTRTGAVA